MSSTRSRRGMPAKPFVAGGVMMTPNRPLIIPSQQEQLQKQKLQQTQSQQPQQYPQVQQPQQQPQMQQPQQQQPKLQQPQQQQKLQQPQAQQTQHQQKLQQPQAQKTQQQQKLQQSQVQQPQQQQKLQQPQTQQPQQPQQQPQQNLQQLQSLKQPKQEISNISIEQNPIPVISTVANNQITLTTPNQNSLNNVEDFTKDDMMMCDQAMTDETINRKLFFRKYLGGSKKKASVRAKERKLRQNKRLKKVLVPKNALMALHELRGVKISDFNVMNQMGGGFICQVIVNNIQYEGFGASKAHAKSDACEKALRDLFISKMLQKPLSKHSSTDNIDAAGATANETENLNNTTCPETGDIEMKSGDGSDDEDLPMINLASYALYKLFSDWQNEGFEIPEFRSSSAASNNANLQPDAPKPPTVRNELPPQWESIHPAMLLCMMRPGSSYTDLGNEGVSPNQIQRVGITIDGENFIGCGRSKKAARKDAAINACNKIFGTNFTKDQQ